MKNEIIDKIYKSAINKSITESYNIDTAVFILCNTYDRVHTEMYYKLMSMGKYNEFSMIQTELRHTYRILLQIIYRHCKKGPLKKDISNSDISIFENELSRLIPFNYMRNIIERYKLGYFDVASTSPNTIEFVRSNDTRNGKYDLYNRIIQHADLDIEDTAQKKANTKKYKEIINPEILKNCKQKGEFHTYDNFFKITYKTAYDNTLFDSEIRADYIFKEFTLDQFRKVYSYILARAMNKMAYCNVLKFKKKVNIIKPMQYSLSLNYDKIISSISNFTSIQEETVKRILDELIYSENFHKNKISIYQPLFKMNNHIICSNWLVVWAIAQKKFLYLLTKKLENQPTLSKIAKDRETIMTNEITALLTYENLLVKTNTVLSLNNQSKAEFDICVFDFNSKTILLIELKWFNQIENEFESKNLDKKFDNFCKNRLQKETVLRNNLSSFLKENIPEIRPSDIKIIASIIISKNNSGNTKINDVVPVIDVFCFKAMLKDSKGSLLYILDQVKDGKYLDMLDSPTATTNSYNFEGINMIVYS